ncbi:MAG: pyridoxal phosphate-dependent aminotransferase [Nitrospinae bacterium]|nr:pyridoxal phosphate-dependent aminotransferase [Nitrospinota bacterium]
MTRASHVARRAREITPFAVMDILERAREIESRGSGVVHLEIGEPDFVTPAPIRRAGIAAIRRGMTHYTHSLGLLELRRAIHGHMEHEHGVTVPPERIMVTEGSSSALLMTLAALVEPGGEVIAPDPCYPCYHNFVEFLGGKTVRVRTHERDGFALDPDSVARRITRRTAAILINSPANPTGMILDAGTMRAIARLGPPVVSDEIYHGLVYEGAAHSLLEFSRRGFVVNGFSKRFAMTGWRLGYVIAPQPYVRPLQRMQQNFTISPNSFSQWGGVAALREALPHAERMRRQFARRRRAMLDALENAGLPVACAPKGAYYVFVNMRRHGRDSRRMAHELLERARVAVTPGVEFGPGGEGFIRLSYANSVENIIEGIRRIARHFSSLAGGKP